jgi:hypothetical protein
MVSIFIVYYESEWFYAEETETGDDGEDEVTKERNESDARINGMRGFNMFLSGIIICLIYKHYKLELELFKFTTQSREMCTFRSTKLLMPMLIEMMVMGLFCPPYMDLTFSGSMLEGTYTYSIDIIIAVVTILRVYLVARMYVHFTIWNSNEANKIARKYGIKIDIFYLFKADLKYKPQLILFLVIGSTILCIGFIVRSLERPFESNHKSKLDFDYLTNGWWLAIVTMTTVGYGDGYPSTHLGRLIMIVTAVLSLVMISLYVVALTLGTMFTKE